MNKNDELVDKLLNSRRLSPGKYLHPGILDEFLARGWYRTGHSLFSVDHIFLNDTYLRVIWLRFRLHTFEFGKKQKEVLRKNAGFSLEIKPLNLSEEHEELYDQYRQSIRFEGCSSATAFLHGCPPFVKKPDTIFPSGMMEVRDGEKLIALGVFDRGIESLSGILNFFHPDYSRYSPGKFLMLKKIELGISLGMPYYYPGYVTVDFPKFDYKFWPGKDYVELFDPLQTRWLEYKPQLVELMALFQHQELMKTGSRYSEVDLDHNLICM
jgi:arginine-tRNA-protein transferase